MVDPCQPLSHMHEAHIQPLHALIPRAWIDAYPLRCHGTGKMNPVESCVCVKPLSYVWDLAETYTVCAYALSASEFYTKL